MFEATLTRIAVSLPEALRVRATRKSRRHGPLPTWIGDPQLSEQLLKDTGLTPNDLRGCSSHDERTAFLAQQNYW